MTATDLAGASSVRLGIAPVSASTASTTATAAGIDTIGYRWAMLVANVGVSAASSLVSTFTITGCDTVGGTYVAITGASLTVAFGDEGVTYRGLVDMAHQPRYIKVSCVSATGGTTLISANVVLYGAEAAGLPDLSSGGADEIQFTVLS